MEMQQYYASGGVGGHDVDWFHSVSELPPLPLCLLPPSPLLTRSVESLVPQRRQILAHGRHSAFRLSWQSRRLLSGYHAEMIHREDAMTSCLPLINPPSPADDFYSTYALPPLPSDLATAGLDDALLLKPFSDIDLDAFAEVEVKPEPLDLVTAMVPLGHDDFGASPTPMEIVNPLQQDNAARGVLHVVPDRNADDEESINVVAKGKGYGAAAVECAGQEAPPRLVKRSSEGSGTAASGKSLDHIGFEELRKYFYMPITKAAREMNVGLTVLKKRCRELGVARWPHRKMKSLRSLILNIQEMGKGAMSLAEVQQELEALERYCARMEENPAIELTEQTKKLRQACFKENYKRRRAAAGSLLDHCYGDFGHQEMPPTIISPNSQSNGFFPF